MITRLIIIHLQNYYNKFMIKEKLMGKLVMVILCTIIQIFSFYFL